jgi:hypothetical protein
MKIKYSIRLKNKRLIQLQELQYANLALKKKKILKKSKIKDIL